jgi:hypothetical protein
MVALYRQRFAGPRRAICGYSGLPERGGGLVALAEDGNHQPPTAGAAPAPFGFLPFLVSSTAFEGGENGDVLTPAGANLGLTNSDINGNFSHNIFTATGGMNVVNRNAAGQILSLDFRGNVTVTGVTPEPSTIVLLGSAMASIALLARRRCA